jgi:hypothetical protein
LRSPGRSYVSYGLICLLVSLPGAAIWFTAAEALMRLCYFGLRHFPNLWPMFATAYQIDARAPWLSPFGYWIMYASILFTWSSLYFGINAMLDLEIERANVARALKLADTARCARSNRISTRTFCSTP